MPSVRWYVNRLRSMSPGEIPWRFRSGLRGMNDRFRVATGRFPPRRAVRIPGEEAEIAPFVLCDATPGIWANAAPATPERTWVDRLSRRADRIAAHRLTFFNLESTHAGDPIDWNRDHETGRSAPTEFSASIDYRNAAAAGDAKVVWEPNRHQHLVVLGRAYRATGQERYADAAVEQLSSWLDQCAFGYGMNWRSPLELAIRAINWVWTYDLVNPSGALDGDTRDRFFRALDLHVWDVSRKYSQGSSANNHLIGEAAGVFIATTYFPWLPDAAAHREQSRRILEEQIQAQTYGDGGTREQAFGYHLFVAQFFLHALAIARRAGHDFSAAYCSRLERMADFVAGMTEAGPLPMVGDADDGYVLDLDDAPAQPAAVLAPAAVLLDRRDFRRPSDTQQAAFWATGRVSTPRHDSEPPQLAPRAFPETGYYLLQCGERGSADAVSVLFDCAELGFGPLAAHGHADALAITIRAFGGDLLVDPGTYDYFSYPEWRDHLRGTRAHNTLTVDGIDQSVPLGPFMWGARAGTACLDWRPALPAMRVSGEHDGYTRLADPVRHRRTVELDAASRQLTIADDLAMEGSHRVMLCLHFAERCDVDCEEGQRLVVRAGGGIARIEIDERLQVTVRRGEDGPGGGWVSRGYHRKSAAARMEAVGLFEGNCRIVTRVRFERTHPPDRHPAAETYATG